jgi:hypothetical protein
VKKTKQKPVTNFKNAQLLNPFSQKVIENTGCNGDIEKVSEYRTIRISTKGQVRA